MRVFHGDSYTGHKEILDLRCGTRSVRAVALPDTARRHLGRSNAYPLSSSSSSEDKCSHTLGPFSGSTAG